MKIISNFSTNQKTLKFLFCFLLISYANAIGQKTSIKVHSHNDYLQTKPFWTAYYSGCESIEVDVWWINNKLLVAHNLKDTISSNTLASMYLQPLNTINTKQKQQPNYKIQLVIDIKSEADSSLKYIIEEIKKYTSNHTIKKKNSMVTFVITGHKPKSENYVKYPKFILFDHQNIQNLSSVALSKVAMVSLSFRQFSAWNGTDSLSIEEETKIKQIIDLCHSKGKPFRFWATPDTPVAWLKFKNLGIDFINTDKPNECKMFLKSI